VGRDPCFRSRSDPESSAPRTPSSSWGRSRSSPPPGRTSSRSASASRTFPTPDHIRLAGIQAITRGMTGYTPSPGIPELREAVARYFTRTRGRARRARRRRLRLRREAVHRLHDPVRRRSGRRARGRLPEPGFPIYEAQIKAHGAVPVPLPLRESRGFNFDIEELKRKINAKTRLLILCSPGNPTGNLLSKGGARGDRTPLRARTRTSGSTPTRSTRAWSTTAPSRRSPPPRG
jgi:histidinol-phosphate/aromatic aminotransferase/cobyric acid decarboxylase-like protein